MDIPVPLKRFFNTSGMLYKSMGLKDKLPSMSEEEMYELLAADGMLVKRPIIVGEDFVLTANGVIMGGTTPFNFFMTSTPFLYTIATIFTGPASSPANLTGNAQTARTLSSSSTSFLMLTSSYVDGLFICGSYGCGPLMTLEERKRVAEVVKKYSAPDVS